MIVWDRRAEDELTRMERDQRPGAPDMSIPSVFVSLASGDALLRLLQSTPGHELRALVEPMRVTVYGSRPKVG